MDAMPCDILISAHPDNAGPGRYSDMPGACRAYAGRSRERLAKRLAEERAVFEDLHRLTALLQRQHPVDGRRQAPLGDHRHERLQILHRPTVRAEDLQLERPDERSE